MNKPLNFLLFISTIRVVTAENTVNMSTVVGGASTHYTRPESITEAPVALPRCMPSTGDITSSALHSANFFFAAHLGL
jgi:hypothetical protein